MNLRLVFWSLRYRRWRHVLNVLIMAFTVGVVVLFVSSMLELRSFARASSGRELSRILVWPKLLQPGRSDLPMAFYPMFKQIEGVKVVQCHKFFFGSHPNGATYMISGEEESGIELNQDLLPVEPAVFEAWKRERPMGAIVTETTAKELNLEVGKLAEIPTPFGPFQVKIVGLSRGGLIARRIAPHFDYADKFTGNKGTCLYRIFTAPADYKRVAREVIERTRNSPTPAQALNDSQVAASWVRSVSAIPMLLGFLGLFLALTTALTLANSASIAVRERRTEIGTLRVLGYRRGAIYKMILGEALLVGLVGGLLAIAALYALFGDGVPLTPTGSRLLGDVALSPLAIGIGLAVSVLIPLLGALPSTIAAVRTPVGESLRDTA